MKDSSRTRGEATSTVSLLKIRNRLVVILTFGVGSVDALSFLVLGGVFASFMSGNTITLGLGIGQGNLHAALHSLTAILGYIAGVALGAYITYPAVGRVEVWPREVTKTLAVEFLLLLSFATIGFASGRPGILLTYVLILLASIPMGMQSAGIHRLGVTGISTTYVTGTWTSFLIDLVTLNRAGTARSTKREQDARLQAVILLVYILGAVVGGILGSHFFLKASVLSVVAVGVVIIAAKSTIGH